MNLDFYLNLLAHELTLKENEKLKIETSLSFLKKGLFENDIGCSLEETFAFGSYSRETILPRRINEESDIDYMLVFENGFPEFLPETYLNKIRRFAEEHYPNSWVHQSKPTIQIDLKHIRIELIPGIRCIGGILEYMIPGKDYSSWIKTSLFNTLYKLTQVSKNIIRLLKYWNIQNNTLFDSFELEKRILEQTQRYYAREENIISLLENMCIETSFISAVNNFNLNGLNKEQINAIKSAQILIEDISLSSYNIEEKINQLFNGGPEKLGIFQSTKLAPYLNLPHFFRNRL